MFNTTSSDLRRRNNVSIVNPQQVFPLARIALEAHAFGNLKGRDEAPLDLLAALSGPIASHPVFSSPTGRPGEGMGPELEMFDFFLGSQQNCDFYEISLYDNRPLCFLAHYRLLN
jgi:hypothetical protein